MLALVVAALLAAPDAAPPPVPDDAIVDTLSKLEEPYEPSRDDAWSEVKLHDPDSLAYMTWTKTHSLPAVQAAFASEYGLEPEAAKLFLAVAVVGGRWATCETDEGMKAQAQRIDRALQLSRETGASLPTLVLLSDGRFSPCERGRYGEVVVDAVRHSPDPGARGLALLQLKHLPFDDARAGVACVVAERAPNKAAAALKALGRDQSGPQSTAFLWAALGQQLKGDPAKVDLSIAERVLQNLLHNGDAALALSVWDSLPAAQRIPKRSTLLGKKSDLALALSGPLIAAGRADEARSLLQLVPPEPPPKMDSWDACAHRVRRDTVRALLGEKIDLFELDVADRSCRGGGEYPWSLLAARLVARRDPVRAREVLTRLRTYAQQRTPPHMDASCALSRPQAERLAAANGERLAAYDAELKALPAPAAPSVTSGDDPGSRAVEKALALKAWPDLKEEPLPESAPKKGRTTPVSDPRLPEGFWAVRAEAQGKRVVAIALSQDLDPMGELGGGGYWVLESKDGGKVWSSIWYTGLRHRQPYVVHEQSTFPLFDPDALLLAVDVQDLDPASITFPPVGLRSRREEKNKLIRLPFAELRKDSDGDGLTDLMEQRLLLDPQNADTDGDGIRDRDDALANVPNPSGEKAPPRPASAEVIQAALEKIFGHEMSVPRALGEPIRTPGDHSLHAPTPMPLPPFGRVLFIEGDRALYRGVDPPMRLVVLSPTEVERATKTFGPFYPLEFDITFNDAEDAAYIEWSERWRGGSLKATKGTDGRWTLESLGSWIT